MGIFTAWGQPAVEALKSQNHSQAAYDRGEIKIKALRADQALAASILAYSRQVTSHGVKPRRARR